MTWRMLMSGVIEVVEIGATGAQSGVVTEHLHERRDHQSVAEGLVEVAFDGHVGLGGHLPVGVLVAQHGEDLVVVVLVHVAHQRSQHLVAPLLAQSAAVAGRRSPTAPAQLSLQFVRRYADLIVFENVKKTMIITSWRRKRRRTSRSHWEKSCPLTRTRSWRARSVWAPSTKGAKLGVKRGLLRLALSSSCCSGSLRRHGARS